MTQSLSERMMDASDYCEELRRRAIAVLDKAKDELSLHPNNVRGKASPHVAQEMLQAAARVTRQLETLAAAAEIVP